MDKVMKRAWKGAIIGVCVGIALTLFLFFCYSSGSREFLGMDISNGGAVVKNCFLYSIPICALCGLGMGFYESYYDNKYAQERNASEEAKKQQAQMIKVTRDEAFKTLTACILNEDTNKSEIIQGQYQADKTMENIDSVFFGSAELLGSICGGEIDNK